MASGSDSDDRVHTPGFVIVGPGRAGGSFASALQRAGWRLDAILGRGANLTDLAHTSEVILLTVPDDHIAEVAAAIGVGEAAIVHVSGAKGLDVLGPHTRRASIHPLVSLPDATTGAARLLEGGTFAVAGDTIANRIVAVLGGRAIEVADESRSRYHATAAIAANHLVVLCAQVERLADGLGIPVDAYWDLMATTLDNVRAAGAVSSLTGPAARGDVSTLKAHLEALPPDEHDLYRTLAEHAATLVGAALDLGHTRDDDGIDGG